MSEQDKNTTGQYPHNFQTGTILLVLERDQFLRQDIFEVLHNKELTEDAREKRVYRKIRNSLLNTVEEIELPTVIAELPEIEKKKKERKNSSSKEK